VVILVYFSRFGVCEISGSPGDQVVRSFAHWAIVCLCSVASTEESQLLGYFFHINS
jgi:hypothetical protein